MNWHGPKPWPLTAAGNSPAGPPPASRSPHPGVHGPASGPLPQRLHCPVSLGTEGQSLSGEFYPDVCFGTDFVDDYRPSLVSVVLSLHLDVCCVGLSDQKIMLFYEHIKYSSILQALHYHHIVHVQFVHRELFKVHIGIHAGI